MPQALLDLLLQAWRQLLNQWAQSGAMCRAARDALELDGEPSLLGELVEPWAAGDFRDLPPIELLPAASMTGAAGAYVISTGMINLNADWLRFANGEQVLSMLTEELGQHLDGLLNASDPPGIRERCAALSWREPGWTTASHDSPEMEHRQAADGGVALATNGWRQDRHLQAKLLHSTTPAASALGSCRLAPSPSESPTP